LLLVLLFREDPEIDSSSASLAFHPERVVRDSVDRSYPVRLFSGGVSGEDDRSVSAVQSERLEMFCPGLVKSLPRSVLPLRRACFDSPKLFFFFLLLVEEFGLPYRVSYVLSSLVWPYSLGS
jgi:hypothetical protein